MIEIPVRNDSVKSSKTKKVLNLWRDHLFQVIIRIIAEPSYLFSELIHFFFTILSDSGLKLSIDLFLNFIPLFVPLVDFSTFRSIFLRSDFRTNSYFSPDGFGHHFLMVFCEFAHVAVDALVDVIILKHVITISIEPIVELLDHIVTTPESLVILLQLLSH